MSTATDHGRANGETHEETSILDQAIDATAQQFDRREAAFLEMQIKTSDRRRREVSKFLEYATRLATIDEETAASCSYSLPRGGKTLGGPSIRLAEICMLAWGNLHAEVRVVEIGEEFVTVAASCWDLETNNRVSEEQPRSIMTSSKKGTPKRFDADMIIVTCKAAMSIALRNAIFRLIPVSLVEQIRRKCMSVLRGEEKTLAVRRAELLRHFGTMGVGEDRVCASVGKRSIVDINLDDLVSLRGVATAIREGATTVEQCFPLKPTLLPGNGNDRLVAMLKGDGEIVTREQAADLESGCKAVGITAMDLHAWYGPDHVEALTPTQAADLRGRINDRIKE